MREIEWIYRQILEIARRRAERAWFKSDRPREAIESQHAQLIPALIHCDDVRRHRHYLEVERMRFVRACGRLDGVREFEPLWQELTAAVDAVAAAADAPIAQARSAMPLDYRNPATRRGER